MPDFCAGDDIITATNGQTRYFPYKSMLYNEENASQTYYGLPLFCSFFAFGGSVIKQSPKDRR